MAGYLEELTLRLAVGASQLPAANRERHAHWIRAKQHASGGFAGREGDADPYYTAFALRSLFLLGELDEGTATASSSFLRDRMQKRDSVVDLISLIFAAAIIELATGQVVLADEGPWRQNVAALLNSLQTDGGGFAKTPEGRAGSTYQTFLSVLCLELIDVPVKDHLSVQQFLDGQRHPDGGYLEIRVAKRAGVNPTAAAIGTLKTLQSLDASEQQDTIAFLSQMQSDEGGLSANTRIPFADLLSTFTGLLTLVDLDGLDELDIPAIQRYASSMEQAGGGFHGIFMDQTADVEYTFYGLATQALLSTL
ncbi:MAG: prenyltransferase/squalene oxidase repeat-containing protein [Planctomycetota bacterium]